jgi:hypothetical protein
MGSPRDDQDDGSEFFDVHREPLPNGWSEFDPQVLTAEDKRVSLAALTDRNNFCKPDSFCSRCGDRNQLAPCAKCAATLCPGCQQRLHGAQHGKPCAGKARRTEAA